MGTSNNIWQWSKTPGSNTTADAGVNWSEGQLPATVNDSARGMMAAVANFRDDIGSLVTSGSANAYTLTTNSGFVSLATGLIVIARVHAANTAASTLNVDGLGAKSIRTFTTTGAESALGGGEIQLNQTCIFKYDATANSGSGGWVLLNPAVPTVAGINPVPTGMIAPFPMATVPTGWLKCNGAAVSRTTYAALFALLGTTYGAGDGSTTFNLPDYRGYFMRGWDDSRGIDSGRALGTTQTDDVTPHTHGLGTVAATAASGGAHTHTVTGTTNTTGAHTHGVSTAAASVSNGAGGAQRPSSSTPDKSTPVTDSAGDHSHTVSGSTDSQGAHTHTITFSGSLANAGTTETRPINLSVMYCIRT